MDDAHAALQGVELRVLGSTLVASTGGDGHFRFDRLAAGVHVLYARKFGYRARQFTVDVMSSDTLRVEIQLEKNA
ncbi:MAG: carboxypeptidase regulatory-like domain-containing protein, partial [Tepidisphaeraceae bacterium]